MGPMVWLLPLCLSAPPTAAVLKDAHFEGGSRITVDAVGHVEVRDPQTDALRWELGLGGPVSHVVSDGARIYAVTGRTLRALAGGEARWALELGGEASGLEVVGRDRLKLRLSGGSLFIDARYGRFCTPRSPCSGLPSWSLGQLGVPYLDLAGLGVPGLGLVLNPWLLESGDGYGAVVSPGYLPGFAPVPAAPLAPTVRGMGSRDGLVDMERSGAEAEPESEVQRGRSGKVRGLRLGGAR